MVRTHVHYGLLGIFVNSLKVVDLICSAFCQVKSAVGKTLSPIVTLLYFSHNLLMDLWTMNSSLLFADEHHIYVV
jgi:hypothetical protein